MNGSFKSIFWSQESLEKLEKTQFLHFFEIWKFPWNHWRFMKGLSRFYHKPSWFLDKPLSFCRSPTLECPCDPDITPLKYYTEDEICKNLNLAIYGKTSKTTKTGLNRFKGVESLIPSRIRNQRPQIDFHLTGFVDWTPRSWTLFPLCQKNFASLRKCLL